MSELASEPTSTVSGADAHTERRRGGRTRPRALQATELKSMIGEQIGTSGWVTIEQDRIDKFAEATGDHQWIHVDPERAVDGPFGSTIAHGFLTLSLIPALAWEVYTIEGARLSINYGLNKLRFISPVKVGSRVRAHLALTGVEDVPGDALQVATTVTVELEGAEKPAAVAETLARIYL